MRNSHLFSTFLDAVNVTSVALIVAICIEMGRDTISDWRTILIAIVSIIFAFGYRKLNSAFIVVGGAVFGWMLSMV